MFEPRRDCSAWMRILYSPPLEMFDDDAVRELYIEGRCPIGALMHTATNTEVAAGLSRQLASYKLTDAEINALADRVVIDGLAIARFNPCHYGICIDYFTDKLPDLATLTAKQHIAKWEVFPYGIIDWDRFRVVISYNVDQITGIAVGGVAGA